MATDPRAPAAAISWCRSERVLWRRTLDGIVVLPPADAAPVALRGPAAAIWELLAAPMTDRELVSSLALTYGADPAHVSADVGRALDELGELGALCRV